MLQYDLPSFMQELQRRVNQNPTEREHQKCIEEFLRFLYKYNNVDVVDVSSNNTITSKHNPTKYCLLSEKECNRVKNKKESEAFWNYRRLINKSQKEQRSKLMKDYGLSKMKNGAPDIAVCNNFVYENLNKHKNNQSGIIEYSVEDNAKYFFTVEVKVNNLSVIESHPYNKSQILSHLSVDAVPCVLLTNGREWHFYHKNNISDTLTMNNVIPNPDSIFELWDENREMNEENFELLKFKLMNLISQNNDTN